MPEAKPEDAIAAGGSLACVEPPIFFDQSGESAPAVAFFPNPEGIEDAKAPLVDARLTINGEHRVVRLVKADVHQLSAFLLEMLGLTEPNKERTPVVQRPRDLADWTYLAAYAVALGQGRWVLLAALVGLTWLRRDARRRAGLPGAHWSRF